MKNAMYFAMGLIIGFLVGTDLLWWPVATMLTIYFVWDNIVPDPFEENENAPE